MNVTIRIRRNQGLLTIAVALVLSACSGSGAPAPTAPVSNAGGAIASAPVSNPGAAAAATQAPQAQVAGTRDACALVTKAEVETAFGESMLEPVASVVHGDAQCQWTHEAGGLDLSISISAQGSTASAIKSIEGAYGANSDVQGVGDAAFEVAGILEFVKGTTLVTFGTGDGSAIITDASFHKLAATAAGRI
jgi:hypothetical protein